MTLHCLYAAPDSPAAASLRQQLAIGDAILLLGAAVRLADAQHPLQTQWLATGCPLYALSDDLAAYAVDMPANTIHAIDYADWVALTQKHATQRVWR